MTTTTLLSQNKQRLLGQSELVLPTDYPRVLPLRFVESSSSKSISGAAAVSLLRLSLSTLSTLSTNNNVAAPFDVLLAAFKVLLKKYSAEQDVSVGSSSFGGKNVLVLRTEIKDEHSFATVIENVSAATRIAQETEVPIQDLLNYMFPPVEYEDADSRANPSLFKVQTLVSTASNSSCDLTVLISQSPTLRQILPIDIKILYNSILFSSARIADLLEQLEVLLISAANDPDLPIGKLSLLTQSSKERLPDPTKDLSWDGFEGAITDIFGRNSEAFPDRVCVVESVLGDDGVASTDRSFTYKQIHEASNIVAHALIKGGIQREDVVVLYSYRGVDLVVAVMGVLKSGATFSVIDPAYPPPRQIVYLQVAQPRGLVVLKKAGELDAQVRDYVSNELQIKIEIPALEIQGDGSLTGGATSGSADDVLASAQDLKSINTNVVLGPDSVGTLSFTSGSTEFKLTEDEHFTMLSGIAHDPIQRDIFTPLFLGAQLHIPTSADIATPGQLAHWMSSHGITVTHLTPAMGQLLSANATSSIPTLRKAFFVGDESFLGC
ncbi:UNVERIFIED_CONTAM: large subunit of alpha-aminoadipate reductase [Siphonaria sp. JEL0065]|nr:large subunit of alpha-aminoadipate reductase [Siphonaria sp. JEL0065]